MPHRDGLEIVRDVRRSQPDLPIVVMSGVTGPLGMLRVAKLLGASHLLKKPFTGAVVLAGIEAAFARNS
jgi:FixJ family two-component response regulator